jgi:four helix bundle protein
MTYQRFEDLPVWNEAIKLAENVYLITQGATFKSHYSLRDQLERAAVSVSNNIAEGFERGTTSELLHFLYIARGSAGEVRSMLCLLERIACFKNLKSQISNLKLIAESCSRQLRAWADKLQNSEVKGQRHLNDSIRKQEGQKKSYLEFQKKLKDMLPANHPLKRVDSQI